MDFAIFTESLTKRYGPVAAVDALGLRIPERGVYGFLGRNGAGKTTTIFLLLNLLKPDAGVGKVLGLDIERESHLIKQRVGFVAETPAFYSWMTVRRVIMYSKALAARWDEDIQGASLSLFDLPLNRRVRELSKGMKTKLMLFLALAQQPDLLILDEPTSGLDPIMREEFLALIGRFVQRSHGTVLISSHELAVVEEIATHIGIIDRGRLIVQASMDDIRSHWSKIEFAYSGSLPPEVRCLRGVRSVRGSGSQWTVVVEGDSGDVVQQLQSQGASRFTAIPATLRDIFTAVISGDAAHSGSL